MFCSQCGRPAKNRFCSSCGAPLEASAEPNAAVGPPPIPTGTLVPARGAGGDPSLVEPELVDDWEHEVSYERLIRRPEVRALIERHAKLARPGITGEELLAIYDQLVPLGISMEKLARVIQPLYAKWGIGTGKEHTEPIPAPAGRVLVRALCSLARNGQAVKTVTQAADGCSLAAELPSDMWSLEGELMLSISGSGDQTYVRAATKIPGQLVDWGKSRRSLTRLFDDLRRDAA